MGGICDRPAMECDERSPRDRRQLKSPSTDRPHPFPNGRVHAKVAVAEGKTAFLTSANLTGHAIEKEHGSGHLDQRTACPCQPTIASACADRDEGYSTSESGRCGIPNGRRCAGGWFVTGCQPLEVASENRPQTERVCRIFPASLVDGRPANPAERRHFAPLGQICPAK